METKIENLQRDKEIQYTPVITDFCFRHKYRYLIAFYAIFQITFKTSAESQLLQLHLGKFLYFEQINSSRCGIDKVGSLPLRPSAIYLLNHD